MKAKRLVLILVCFLAVIFLAACHEHVFDSYTISVAPTGTATGTATAECDCGETSEIQLPALSDTTVWTLASTVDATCTEEGSKTYTSIYGNVVIKISASGHEHSNYQITTKPTETEKGSATATCSCGNSITVDVPALTDTVWSVNSTTNATCTEEGSKTYTSIYGDVTVVLSALTHQYGAWSVSTEPTTTSKGLLTRVCSYDANHTETFELPALDKTDYTCVTDDPACGETGKETYTYSKDGQYFTFEVELPALTHVYGSWSVTTEPTTTSKGLLTRVCSHDANHTETFELPALNKVDYTYSVIPPVCGVSDGNETYKYSKDEQILSFEVVVPKTDHLHDEYTITTDPTETTIGKATAKCDCGNEIEVDVPVLTDTTVWELTNNTLPDYNNAGSKTYESIYGEVTIGVTKLVAPYDGKTYTSLNFEAATDGIFKNGVVNAQDTWSIQAITIDDKGTGIGVGYPFRGYFEIKMVNPATGEIQITKYDIRDYDGDGNYTDIDTEVAPTVKTAYVDFATGIIMCEAESYAEYNLWTPFEEAGVGADGEQAIASSWDNAIVISYTDSTNTTHNIFVYNSVVYFGVSFVDIEGNAIAANECYNAAQVYVEKDNETIASFAYNGTKLVVADGYEGTYIDGENELVVTGAGIAYYNGLESTYVIAPEGSSYTAGVYAAGQYFEVTLDMANKTFTMVMPKVAIHFEAGEMEIDDGYANINVPYELLVLENTETHTFKGWCYDEACTQPVESPFIPTEETTLYASWKAKVVITLVGVAEGDEDVLYLGEGDIIGDYLPSYGLDTENNRRFEGWFLDESFENSLPEDAAVTSEDTGITIYAKWASLPAYYGSYKGSEIWNASFGNSGGKTLTIDENGNMSGLKTGIIISYDPETQVVEWKTNSTSTTVYKFYYNATLGVIAGLYNNTEIGNDYYILSKYDEDGKANANYGIEVPKTPGSATRGWYAQFVNITTALGDVEVFMYNNYIYDTFTATDTSGNSLTAATVKNSKTLVVKDAEGNVIVSVASTGNSFSAVSKTVDLDAYYGTYTTGDETVVLDGVGNITYGDLTGTYALVSEGETYVFDVYLSDGSQYYELTLNGTECTIVKVMVEITYEEGEYANIEDVDANKNIPFTLPILTHETQVFNGWFYDENFTRAVESTFIPTEDTTLYALWKVKVTLTINANNGSETQYIVYSEGDNANIDVPVLSKFKFAGWYTTPTFDEATEWLSGSIIESDIVIYAKWEEAPAYYNTYTITRLTNSSSYVDRYSDMYCYKNYSTGPYLFTIDANGHGVGTNSPLNGNFEISNYDETTGYLEIVLGSTVYKGYLDSETGIIITNYLTTSPVTFKQVFFFNPFTTEEMTTSTISCSYWTNGTFRAISYTFEENTYTAFVNDEQIYFGVSFEDAEGNSVAGVDCYNQSVLYVKDKDGQLIAKFAHDGTVLQEMDGNEGTYTNGEDTLVIDGVVTATLNGVKGTYAASTEGSSYGFDVYVDGVYYEVSLNKEEMTYTINKPMVSITYNTDDKDTIEQQTVNKNIAITLPTPTNDEYIFRGWYLEETYTTVVTSLYIPTEDVTLYAKWDAKVTLTVVYGNGLDNATLYYGVGDTTAPKEPVFTNGQVFNGWYLDSEFNTAYTPGVIETSTTIYCKWMEAVAMYGTYYGANVYGSGNKTVSYINKNLSITPDGQVSGDKTGTVESYDPETKTFKINTGSKSLYVFFDVESGILAVAYGSNETGLGTDINLFANKEISSMTQSDNLNGAFNKLITINYKDGTSVNYLLMGDVVYSNVTFSSNSGDYTSQLIGNASDYVIKDKDGNILLSK